MSAPASILPLAFDDVSFSTPERALLHGVSFRCEAGGISVLLGPNGAGKSLVLRLASGLLTPSSGAIRWVGASADGASTARAIVLQRPVLLRRSVSANVAYPLARRGVARAQRAARAARALEATRLAAHAQRPARTLSVGEQQRVAMACAWACDPEVLLLDEPAAALDPSETRELERAISAMRDEGRKIVMSTHDLAQARRLASEVLFLHGGRLLEQTPAPEFFARPRSDAGRRFLAGELLA
ncbi:MAG: energy-coupling factor ABC transporter ATP-binding protein [Myxococcota bacterium]|jgi:tungstate transport system ATP-binding protein